MTEVPFPHTLQDVDALSADAWQSVIRSEATVAAQWLRTAADLGHSNAQAILGQWLLDGHGVASSPKDALRWFLKSGTQGHVLGMNMCGRCFENGWGTEIDMFIAANWYRQAAQSGLDAGMYNYANLLSTGCGVRMCWEAALEWYQRAAAQGHAKSMTKIGHFYEDGRVVSKDTDAAFLWFERAARGGDFRGQFNYAGMLAARGLFDDALVWLNKAAQTATVGYKKLAGEQLLQSPHPAVQEVGRRMLLTAI